MAISSARSDLFEGRYLLHFHTVATDGSLTVDDYFDYARTHHFDRLVWLEHIRRQPTYDVAGLVAVIRRRSSETGIASPVGFEAKVLPDGSLDISPEHLALADIVGIAEHGFRGAAEDLERALSSAFRQITTPAVWVHPGSWFRKQGLLEQEHARYVRLLHLAEECGILIERNSRYQLLRDEDRVHVHPDSIVFGADAHTWADLARHEELSGSLLCASSS